jgi:CBS domain containing-hemolysin-like protein
VPQLAVATLVRPAVWLPAATPLAQAMEHMNAYSARAMVVVDSAGRPIAIADEARVRAVDATALPWTTLGQVADPASLDHALPITLTGRELLHACQANPASGYIVLDTLGQPIGVLAAADIRTALTTAASTT